MPEREPLSDFAAVEAAQRLRLEAATGDVARAFQNAGVPCILLKGITIARWLYEEGSPRAFSDCDLLISPPAWAAAEATLRELGFRPAVDEAEMPDWWVEHGLHWWRDEDGAAVDLHRTLASVGAEPDHVWGTLSANVEPIVVGGVSVNALNIPARAFHVAHHAAQHAGMWGTKVEELRRALAQTDEATWAAAAQIAAELEATGMFALGLRMVPEGEALAERLDLPTDAPVDAALLAAGAPPEALGFEQLARAGTLRGRMAIVRHKLIPPVTFMKKWSPLSERGRFGLLLAYLWRPVWLLGKAPAGFRAWRSARRTADTD